MPVQQVSTIHANLESKLGVARISCDRELASMVEKHLPSGVIKSLGQAGLTDAEIYELIIPRRTLAHRLAKKQSLSRDESDRAVRVARVAAMAEQIFGEPERAWRWLRKAKRQFDGKSPMDMLLSETGARVVEELLTQIDDGLVA